MKAAYEIVARRGFEGLVIQDITGAADVGYGSFYNHFTSKDAIVSAVIDAARLYTREVFNRVSGLALDRAEAFAIDLRLWLQMSRSDPVWGWFMIRTVLSGEDLRAGIGGILKRGLQAGAEDGTFRSDDLHMAHEIIGGLLLLGTLKIVSGEVPADYANKIVRTALQTLNIPDQKIAAIMKKPLPDLGMPRFLEACSQKE